MTLEDAGHEVVATAVPVLSGVVGTLQDILTVGGQVMLVIWPLIIMKGAIASHPVRTQNAILRLKGAPWGLEPW